MFAGKKTDYWPKPHTFCKNQVEMDQGLKCKSQNHETFREKIGESLGIDPWWV